MFTTSNGITIFGNDLTLDDWTENVSDKDLSYGWTQICEKHIKDFPESAVDYNSGHGICGVKGCNNEADHYVDFDREDIDE